jgi:hypothetical protein
MTTKIYLICEDVDLGCHVYGIYNDKDYAVSKLDECLEVWAKMKFLSRGKEIPEEINKPEKLRNSVGWHNFWLDERDLNCDKRVDENNEWKLVYIQLLDEAKKENQNDN